MKTSKFSEEQIAKILEEGEEGGRVRRDKPAYCRG